MKSPQTQSLDSTELQLSPKTHSFGIPHHDFRIYVLKKVGYSTTCKHCILSLLSAKHPERSGQASLVNLGRSLNAVVEIGVTFQTSEMSTAVSYRMQAQTWDLPYIQEPSIGQGVRQNKTPAAGCNNP